MTCSLNLKVAAARCRQVFAMPGRKDLLQIPSPSSTLQLHCPQPRSCSLPRLCSEPMTRRRTIATSPVRLPPDVQVPCPLSKLAKLGLCPQRLLGPGALVTSHPARWQISPCPC